MPTVLWFRRDLRLHDLPALVDAAQGDGRVLACYVLDPRLHRSAGQRRLQYLHDALRELDDRLDGRLLVTRGRPEQRIPALAKGIDASAVYVSDDFTPFGRRRDDAVRQALGAVALEASGSPYLVSPGRVTKGDGTPYKVFTPFFGAWRKHGWRAPAQSGPDSATWDSATWDSATWDSATWDSATWIDPADPTGRDLRAEGAAAEQRFDAWQRGHTGFPIVDAGMRQLAGIGWMHNRVRMIVASFLVKDLHLPWQWGARWFLEQLVDADMANKRWPTISTGGSGPRVAVPTPHRSSGCSTRRRRGRNSIRTACTCGGGCPN